MIQKILKHIARALYAVRTTTCSCVGRCVQRAVCRRARSSAVRGCGSIAAATARSSASTAAFYSTCISMTMTHFLAAAKAEWIW